MTDLKEIITDIVNTSQGIMGRELIMKVMEVVNPMKFDLENKFKPAIEELLKDNQIIEVTYSFPTISHKKYMYFPKGTKFN